MSVGRFLAVQSVSQARRFRDFPKIWGRRVRWFDLNKSSFMPLRIQFITMREAERMFWAGKAVGYITHGFPYAIVYDPAGQKPSI